MTCDDEAAALRREAELLVSLKPRFNRAGVWPKPKWFLAWRAPADGLELTVTERPGPDWRWAGPSGAQMAHSRALAGHPDTTRLYLDYVHWPKTSRGGLRRR